MTLTELEKALNTFAAKSGVETVAPSTKKFPLQYVVALVFLAF
jgi:hypothetical protein